MRERLIRLISFADEPGDDDDLLLRKRIGVVAGFVTAGAALTVIPLSQYAIVAWVLGLALSLFSIGNLVLLARSHRFGRYVVALLATGAPFTLIAHELNGGIAGGSVGMLWAFLGPVYAILALGPRPATRWFAVFVVTLLVAVAIDPLVGSRIAPPPYSAQLLGYVVSIGGPCTITFLLLRYSDVRRREAQARSDELLTNAIPMSIATRLMHGEQHIAEAYPETTVLFSDIVGFTPWAQATDPARVVLLLDGLFSRFDELASECGLEKIKTIGDAYMAVAGAPSPLSDHAEAALTMARSMLAAVAEWRTANDVALQMRVGLASGPVVAGVIGQKRLLFDLWGDTVNMASRMESSGVPGRIQVAPSTFTLVRERHPFDEREVEVKGLGIMTTHLLRDEVA